MSPEPQLRCYLCRTPCHLWGFHLYCDCLSTALACQHGFKAVAPSMQPGSRIQWQAVNWLSVPVEGSTLLWYLVHPTVAPVVEHTADVTLSWSAPISVSPWVPLPAESATRQCESSSPRWPSGRSLGLSSDERTSVVRRIHPAGPALFRGQLQPFPLPSLTSLLQLTALRTPYPLAYPAPPCIPRWHFDVCLSAEAPPPGWAGVWFKPDTEVLLAPLTASTSHCPPPRLCPTRPRFSVLPLVIPCVSHP